MKTNQMPKFNRQKFLLMFLKHAGGNVSKLDLQKLLFLFHRKYRATFFEFVPYLYGCYSFQANADLEVLQAQGWLQIQDNAIKLTNDPAIPLIDNDRMKAFFAGHAHLAGNSLIKEVYCTYPYYAINSRIANSILDKNEIGRIVAAKQKFATTTEIMFTIGYEGITFEGYINMLIQNDIRLLCDVRNNPLSRKFGFSKSMFAAILPKIDIQYVHIPELGIESSKRQDLDTVSDYSKLFADYNRLLPDKKTYVEAVVKLLQKNKRIALTCFEKEPAFCHRHTLSEYIQKNHPVKVIDL